MSEPSTAPAPAPAPAPLQGASRSKINSDYSPRLEPIPSNTTSTTTRTPRRANSY
jgi:hypothetical protein